MPRYNENTGEVSMTDPLIDFNGHDTPDGHKYWINPKTKEATWCGPGPRSLSKAVGVRCAGEINIGLVDRNGRPSSTLEIIFASPAQGRAGGVRLARGE